MPRYIDADALIKRWSDEHGGAYFLPYEIIRSIDEQPTADVVERKHREWIYHPEASPYGNPYGHYECDRCGEYVPHMTNYCPNCGADMRGADDAEVH